MKKVIIDVDTGIDDALALIVALKSKKLNVLGVTTVAGNISVDLATENTLRVLKLLKHEELEVYKGCYKPIARNGGFKEAVHGERGLAGQLKSMKTKEESKVQGVDFIIDEVQKSPGEISLIMLGPLTNLATALRKDPTIADKLKSVYVMGGAFNVPGNITPVAEFNFYADPEAVYEVLKSGIKPKIVGLDVTTRARLFEEDLKNINKETELGRFVYNVVSFFINKSSTSRNDKSCSLHDPLVVSFAMDEKLIELREVFVDIEYSSRICDGQSVSYYNRSGYEANAEIAISHDDQRFKKIFLDLINEK